MELERHRHMTVHALPLFEMKEENPIVYVGVGKRQMYRSFKANMTK